jgi:hypothetical protein
MTLRAARLDLGDRKEVWQLLQRLDERRRLEFLRWACRQVRGPDRMAEVRVTNHTGTVHETYMDLMHLEVAFGLDLAAALAELVRRVRRL